MTVYCLESGAEDSDNAIVHKLECASYDLGTLLGAGRLVSLGHFDNALTALEAVRTTHPHAVRCEDCCQPARVVPLPLRVSDIRTYAVA